MRSRHSVLGAADQRERQSQVTQRPVPYLLILKENATLIARHFVPMHGLSPVSFCLLKIGAVAEYMTENR